MSLNQIHYSGTGDTIDETLNLKANSIQVKGNINVPFINGLPYVGGAVNVGTPRQILQTDAAGINPEWTSDIKVDDCEIDGQININGVTGSNNQVIVKVAGVPAWGTPTFTLPSIPIGSAYQTLRTNSTATSAEWSSDIRVNNCEVDQQINISGDNGVDGQVIVKAAGVPTWGTPSFTLPSIPVGTPLQLLQTNSGGTSAQWTSSITVQDEDIIGNLKMNGNAGATGQALVKSGTTQVWGNIGSTNITPGTANYIMTTNPAGTSSQWSQDLIVRNENIIGNLSLNSLVGVTGQFVKKISPSSQQWSNVTINDLAPGSNNQALLTNSSGTGTNWSYIGPNSVAPGGAWSLLTSNSAGTSVAWSLVNTNSIQPGGLNQILTTNGSGVVAWSNSLSPSVTPGLPYQILQTDAAGTGVEWTSQFHGSSVLFNSANQSTLDRYYRGSAMLDIYLVPSGGSNRYLQGVQAKIEYYIIGKSITITVYPFTLTTPIGTSANCYVALYLNNNLWIPDIVAPGPSNNRQATVMCSTASSFTTSLNPSFANVYTQYYSFGLPFIEITSSDAGTYDANGNHGGVFVNNIYEYMELKAPFSVQYFLN